MDMINLKIVNQLLEISGETLISLYMPTHRVGREMQQDPIRLKNLLDKAEENLAARGLRKLDVERLLDPAQQLQNDSEFWQHLSTGLAIFLAPDFMQLFRLPVDFDPLLIIAERFHIKPLLPLLSKNGHFFVMALSQQQIRLFEGSRFSIDEIDLESIPTSLREALAFDDPEKQLQLHTQATTPSSTASHPAAFHGQGASETDAKTDLLRYFQKLDRGIMELFRDEQAPLVLAGVDYLLPIYAQANSYAHLINESIEGNPEHLNAADLHQQAWQIIEPIFAEDQSQAAARFQELLGSDSQLATASLDTILPAAHYGQVEILFVSLGIQIWGSYTAKTNTLEQHQEFKSGDQDLLELAAAQTLLNGGVVYALHPDEMPGEIQLGAVLRYAYGENRAAS